MGRYWGVICFGLCLLVGTASDAATIIPLTGEVSLNQGQGFQKIYTIADAKEGSTVMVSPDGSASIAYSDGCKVSLQPGMVMTIAAVSPCASKVRADDQSSNLYKPWAFGSILAAATGVVIYEVIRSSKAPQPVSP